MTANQYWPQNHRFNQTHYNDYADDIGGAAGLLHTETASPSANYNSPHHIDQDAYRFSPLSGDLFQPEEIFQLDQPIKPPSLQPNQQPAHQSSPPPILLDLGSGAVENKITDHNQFTDLTDSFYGLHEDSTSSSQNKDTSCYYVGESRFQNNNNHLAVTRNEPGNLGGDYYSCDMRPMGLAINRPAPANRLAAKNSTQNVYKNIAAVDSSDILTEFHNAESMNWSHLNYKVHKRKTASQTANIREFSEYGVAVQQDVVAIVGTAPPTPSSQYTAYPEPMQLTHCGGNNAKDDEFLSEYAVPESASHYLLNHHHHHHHHPYLPYYSGGTGNASLEPNVTYTISVQPSQ